MADEKNIDVQATSNELNDEALNKTSGGFEILLDGTALCAPRRVRCEG